jgi:endo-1,4-beta-xylanase
MKIINANSILWVMLFVLSIATPHVGQCQTPEAIADLIDSFKLRKVNFKKGNLGHIEVKKEKGKFTYLVSTDTFVENAYNLSVELPTLKRPIGIGQKLLLKFAAKTLSSSVETGEARAIIQLHTGEDMKNRIKEFVSIGNEWSDYYILFDPEKFIPKKAFKIDLQFGFPPQQFLCKDFALYLFDAKTDVTKLPKTSIKYKGMEAEAEWRLKAFERIEKIRKGDIQLKIKKGGNEVPNADVKITMIKHEFKWGAAIKAEHYLDKQAELDQFSEYFNMAVLENDLKMKHWNSNKQSTIKFIDQLNKKDIAVKGHVLIWPGFKYLTANFQKFKSNPKKLNQLVNDHLQDILTSTKGKIAMWDVVNEAYTNKDLQEITKSEEILYDGFRMLKTIDPNVGRFVNEYGIISRGGLNKVKQDWYYDFVSRIDKSTDNAVTGIGMQSHIGTDLTPPEKVLEILDKYGKLQKDLSISEFTLDITDPYMRKIYTEDFLIAAFSHPNVSQFLFWGFKGNNKSKVDIIQENGDLGSMGQAFYPLVHGLWKTKLNGKSDAKGLFQNRGFYGTYEYEITIDGKIKKGVFTHSSGKKTEVLVEF